MKKGRIALRQSRPRSRGRLGTIREHRHFMLDRAFDMVLAGKVAPGYITYRAKKYKEVAR